MPCLLRKLRFRLPPLACLWLSVCLGASPAPAPSANESEASVTAEILVTFAQLVDWPDSSRSAQLTICVLGLEAVPGVWARVLHGRTINARPIQLQLQPKGIATLACDVAFIPREEASNAARHLGQLRKSGVLTVSNAPGFLDAGGHIGLFVEEGRLRFEVNPEAAKRSSLKLNSKLIKLGQVRKPKPV